MNKEECFNLGYVARKIGNQGELGFVLDVDDPMRYRELQSVFLERNHSLIPFFIRTIHIRGKNATVSLEGVDSIAQAEELVGSSLYLPLSFLPKLSGKKFYYHEMPGYLAIDVNIGELGPVTGVLDFPQQAIFQIKMGMHEVLVPAKDEFIVNIDRDKKVLLLQMPEGLIDVYTGGKKDEEE